ncbi:MAG: MFS transporter, partial [Paraburkholderia sp.]
MTDTVFGTTRTLDVQQFIDARRFSPYQWFVLILCFLIVATDGFDTAAIGFVAPSLAQEWHATKAALAPVMSAALVGLAIGALAAGPLADRIGRKKVLVGSVLVFGALSIACAFAGSVTELAVLRLLTGIGLGAAMPNATTLTSEYAPARKRSLLVNTMFCGFTVGASAGGLVAAALIPHYGWRSVFVAGGAMPIVLGFVLIGLPESIRFMVLRGWPVERIAAVLRRIAPNESFDNVRFVLPEDPTVQRKTGGSVVLSARFRTGTIMLWVTYFSGLLVYYMLTSWLPTLIRDTGFTVRQAALVTALFPFGGGVGSIAVGWLMDRFEPHRVIAITYVLTGLFVWMVGQQSGSLVWLAAITFIAGVCMNGAQS